MKIIVPMVFWDADHEFSFNSLETKLSDNIFF